MIKGEKFGRLTALGESERRAVGKTFLLFEKTQCECGNIARIRRDRLKSGHTKSCGCITLSRNGESCTRFSNIYRCIVKRCTNPEHSSFSIYGGKGIKCEWESYEDFKRDMYDSYVEHCKKFGKRQTTIDRIDVNGDYSKENCKRSTYLEQNRNRRFCKNFIS